jgi:hypothetical protein
MTIATAEPMNARILRKRANPSTTKLPPNALPSGMNATMKAAATSSMIAPRLTTDVLPSR